MRGAIACEAALTREVIRLNGELLRADLRALEARLTLRIGMMMVAWFAAAAVLILDR